MLARKKIKYPAMNLMGNVQKLYKENFKNTFTERHKVD